AYTACLAAEVAALQRNHHAVVALADRAIAMATDHGMPGAGIAAGFLRHWALGQPRPDRACITAMQQALAQRDPTGERWHHTVFLSLLVDAHLRRRDADAAEACLREVFAYVARTGERLQEAELHRLMGEVHLTRLSSTRTGARKMDAAAQA